MVIAVEIFRINFLSIHELFYLSFRVNSSRFGNLKKKLGWGGLAFKNNTPFFICCVDTPGESHAIKVNFVAISLRSTFTLTGLILCVHNFAYLGGFFRSRAATIGLHHNALSVLLE